MAAEWEWERVPTSVGTGRGSEVRPIIKDGVWEDAKVRVYQYAPPGYLVFMEKTGPNYQAIVSTPAEQARIKEELKFGPLALLLVVMVTNIEYAESKVLPMPKLKR